MSQRDRPLAGKRDWLLITSRSSWELLEQASAWKFAEKSASRAQGIQSGDRALVYIMHESVFAAIISFTGTVQRSRQGTLFDGLFPYRVPFSILAAPGFSVPVQPLVGTLRFFTNKRVWSAHLQGHAIRPLERADFELVARRLSKPLPSLAPDRAAVAEDQMAVWQDGGS